ncbi:MAG: TonB-dependent receptor, partial [Acidobacterium ailaaui]|nr:TonB-dependent receptor [Pseudacidobacterium ailaaui]
FIGYERQEIPIAGRSQINIQMHATATGLNQVVVVGYGTQKKANLTGAVTQIDNKMLQDRPVDNVGQALQGVVPNLNINFSNGRPGAPAKVNIRGYTSVNGGQPLVLVDGVPGDINLINPNDIATITVLKDASSAAIYGARAAYGVILVTTKDGSPGKLKVTYSANFASSVPTTSHSFMTDGYSTAKLIDSAFKISTGNNYTGYTAADYDSLKLRQTNHSLPSVTIQNRNGQDQYVWYGNTDWWRYFFKNSMPSMSHSLEFSGGSKDVTFMVSGRYYQQKGLMRFGGDKYTDYNLRAKVHADIKPWLTIDNNFQFDANVYNWPGWRAVDDIFTYLGVHMLPSYVPVNPDGTFTFRSNLNNYGMADGYHLELESGKSVSQQKNFDLTNTFSVTITPIPSLSIQASYSYDLNPYSQYHRSVVTPWSIKPGIIEMFNNDNYSEEMDLDQYHVASAYATYQKNLGRNSFKIMGGYDQEFKKYHVIYGSGNNLLSQDLNALDLATSGQTVGSNSVAWALLGFFGRVNYSYNDKYLLELDGRYDGSSHFPPKTRFGFFPSVSAGWRISEEPFFSPLKKVISELKLRGSYGSLGNQSLSTNLRNNNYPYIPLMSTGLSTWLQNGNKIQYLRVGAPVPPELTWERTLSADGGIDFGLFNNQLTGSFDWYDRKTLDMLVAGPTLPAVFGAASPKANAANLDTKGWEFSIQWSDNTQVAGKTFTYSVGIVLSNFVSHITKFNNPSKLLNNYYEGQRLGDIWGYTVDGFFKSDDEAKNYAVNQDYVNRTRLGSPGDAHNLHAGDMKFVDLNGDGVVNNGNNTVADHGDLRIIGNNLPQFPFGVNGSVSWNGISLSVFFQGIGHQDWYPGNEAYMFWGPYGRPYYTFIPKDIQSKMWTPQNPNAYFPRLRGYVALNGNSELTVPNNMYLQNIAYIRLKSIIIGYTLPAGILKALKVENIRFYLSGNNIFTASPLKSKYIDPEQVSADPNGVIANVSARNYPFKKTYSGGFNITF